MNDRLHCVCWFFGAMIVVPALGHLLPGPGLVTVFWFGRDLEPPAVNQSAWLTACLVLAFVLFGLAVGRWRAPRELWLVAAAWAALQIVRLMEIVVVAYAGRVFLGDGFTQAIQVQWPRYFALSAFGSLPLYVVGVLGYPAVAALACWVGTRWTRYGGGATRELRVVSVEPDDEAWAHASDTQSCVRWFVGAMFAFGVLTYVFSRIGMLMLGAFWWPFTSESVDVNAGIWLGIGLVIALVLFTLAVGRWRAPKELWLVAVAWAAVQLLRLLEIPVYAYAVRDELGGLSESLLLAWEQFVFASAYWSLPFSVAAALAYPAVAALGCWVGIRWRARSPRRDTDPHAHA